MFRASPKNPWSYAGPAFERAQERRHFGVAEAERALAEGHLRVGDEGPRQLLARLLDDVGQARALVGEAALERARRQAQRARELGQRRGAPGERGRDLGPHTMTEAR